MCSHAGGLTNATIPSRQSGIGYAATHPGAQVLQALNSLTAIKLIVEFERQIVDYSSGHSHLHVHSLIGWPNRVTPDHGLPSSFSQEHRNPL